MTAPDDQLGLVVVGGGAAGHACVAAYRRHGGQRPITLVTADDRLPYFRPNLTKELLTGEIDLPSMALEPDDWYTSLGVEVLLACTAQAIDLTTRTVDTDRGPVRFDSLVLATGSTATRLPVPGADDSRVCTVRTAADAKRLLDGIESGERALLIGSGFVGCEVAASLRVRGIDVVMVTAETLPQTERLGIEAGQLIAGWLQDLGVEVHAAVQVERLELGSSGVRAHLGTGGTVDAGWVVMATGAATNVGLAETAGLVVDKAVPVDASMRTAALNVFAIGDIARADNEAAGRALRVEHWGDADRMGTIAGTVAAGSHDTWRTAPGFWTSLAGRQLKYVAWGDGHDTSVVRRSATGLTVWYAREGVHVGVLTFEHDEDLEAGTALIERSAPFEMR